MKHNNADLLWKSMWAKAEDIGQDYLVVWSGDLSPPELDLLDTPDTHWKGPTVIMGDHPRNRNTDRMLDDLLNKYFKD